MTITDHLTYDGFGQISWQSSATDQPRFGYDGMPFVTLGDASDPVAPGLSYANARWYDPVTGNFVSQDPLGFGGGQTNTSEYCGNGPTNYVDPSGEYDSSLNLVPQYVVGGQYQGFTDNQTTGSSPFMPDSNLVFWGSLTSTLENQALDTATTLAEGGYYLATSAAARSGFDQAWVNQQDQLGRVHGCADRG